LTYREKLFYYIRRQKLMLWKIFKTILPVVIFIVGFLIASSSFRPQNALSQTTCTTPDAVLNVLVEYPSTTSGSANFTQADCSWAQVANAANYNVVVTELETSTTIYNQQVPSTTTKISFGVTQGRTYKCDVAAVNSCGTAGPVGSFQLLCGASAGVSPTTAPTVAPTSPPATSAPQPTMKPTGTISTTFTIGSISFIFLIAGGALFFL